MNFLVRVCARGAPSRALPSCRCSRVVGRASERPPTRSHCQFSLQSKFEIVFSTLCRWLSRATSTYSQLSAMDVSVRSTMKGAAKCDKHCELQNSVNRQGLERILCFWDIPESMPASVSTLYCSSSCSSLRGMLLVISCTSGRALSRRS